jgi:two-component system, OmpR family, phosphate regulon response regulator PhoB
VIALTWTEHTVLKLFFDSPDAVVTHRMLWERVWSCDNQMSRPNIDAFISRLRRKLANAGDHIETMRGTGYRLAPSSVAGRARATA